MDTSERFMKGVNLFHEMINNSGIILNYPRGIIYSNTHLYTQIVFPFISELSQASIIAPHLIFHYPVTSSHAAAASGY